MSFILRHLPDVLATLLGLTVLRLILRGSKLPGWVNTALLAIGCAGLSTGMLLRSVRIASMLPLPVSEVLRLSSFMLLIVIFAVGLTKALMRLVPKPSPAHSPERRKFLLATRNTVMASPLIATGYGVFVQRDSFRVCEVDIRIPGLAKELEGFRMVQLSDIHLSPFLSERELARAVDMANETNAHIALVTGDLITGYRDPLDACIQQVGRLRAEGGVLGCLGNHESYARVERYTTEHAQRLGVRFLRDESTELNFRGASVNFTGVDYQRMHSDYLVGTERHLRPGMLNILLSHNPDVFPIAARKGFHLTLAGHTHGGQITVEILNQNVSVARFYTPYVYGLYHEGNASAYVTRGIGTVGVPARIGAPPEVALIRLCAT